MNKILIICFMLIGMSLYAGPHGGPRGCPPPRPGCGWGPRPGYRPPPPPCGRYYYGNSGLADAAAITSIVANGVSIMSNLQAAQQPVVVQPQPAVVQQPQVVVQQQAQPTVVQTSGSSTVVYR